MICEISRPLSRSARTHCPQGHPYDEANTYRNNGRRSCRACSKDRSRIARETNREACNARALRWRRSHPERAAECDNKQMLRKYGLTPQSYAEMLETQEGVCCICSKECSTGRKLAVDHNHETGEVRGLLCANCNNGLGRFKDDVGLLKMASEYLTKTKTVTLT